MDPKEKELVEQFNDSDITVFYGKPLHYANTDFELFELEALIEYCSLNDINSVFFDCQYTEDPKDMLDQLKNALEHSYKSQVNGYVTGILKLPHIDESFYAPVWEKVVKALDRELETVNDTQSGKRPDDTVTSITVWVFHQGVRLYYVVDLTTDDSTQMEAKPKILKQKYQTILSEELSLRRQEAYKESKKIEQKKQQVILDEIAQMVHQDPVLSTMFTVKARNDYADRICVTWQVERGHEWLTKKAVRAIVELDYVNR